MTDVVLSSNENLVAELEAAAGVWLLNKNKYTLESLRDARRAVLKQMQPPSNETGERCLAAGCAKPPMCAAFCEEHSASIPQDSVTDAWQSTKEDAYKLDPECWVSYSGKPREFKRAMEVRRAASLKAARVSAQKAKVQREPTAFEDFVDSLPPSSEGEV